MIIMNPGAWGDYKYSGYFWVFLYRGEMTDRIIMMIMKPGTLGVVINLKGSLFFVVLINLFYFPAARF